MEYRTIKLFLLLFPFYILNSIFHIPASSAAGIEVSPARLDLQVGPEAATAEITVANPTADVQVFEIYADDFTELFEFNPASFTLESGARKSVHLQVSLPRRGEGQGEVVATTISILATPLADSRVQTATGVKIPVSITTTDQKQTEIPYPAIAGTIAGIVAVIYLSFFRPRNST